MQSGVLRAEAFQESFRGAQETLVHEPVHEMKSTRANPAAERMNPAYRISYCRTYAELQVYS
jgi:hypothetical protein